MKKDELIEQVMNKQFQMIGEKITIASLPEDGLIEVGKKKIMWYQHYKFDSLEQYEQWRSWAEQELSSKLIKWKKELDFADMIYGMSYKIPKTQKGQLDLF